MEYVEGKPIDDYTAGVDARTKIELFVKVCDAVSYLHRNLVVHRDLKPANILVTAQGEPKLLDFGIAKMLDLSIDETATAMRMLTPEYASPEQMAGAPLTTATDIYSLGAILCTLVTGKSPHRFEDGFRLRDVTPPSQLAPGVKGDLETIILKALRQEPEERYVSVEQFSEDLQNYLDSRPVRARKGGVWYRTRKFLRRHWVAVVAGGVAVAGLTTGVLVANHEREIAQRRFVDVRQLANKLFDIDAEVRRTPGTTKARQLIVDTALDYLRRISADVRLDPELSLEVGNAYMRVGRVQGVPISLNLGQLDQAERNLRIAQGFVESTIAAQPWNRTAMLRSAQIAHDEMLLARYNGRYDEALTLAQKSAAWLEKFNAGAGDKSEAASILNTYLNVADQHMRGRRYDDALQLCRRATDLALTYHSEGYRADFLWVSASVLRSQGDLDEALKQASEWVRVLEAALHEADHGVAMNLAQALTVQGSILGEENTINLGRPQEAVAVLDRAFRLADAAAHQDPVDQNSRGRLALTGIKMAKILRHSDPERSLAIYDHALRHLAEIANNASFRRIEASALAGSTYPLRDLGRSAEARQRLDAAFDRLRRIKAWPAERIQPASEPDDVLCALAAQEDLTRAIEVYEDLLRGIQAWGAKPDSNLGDAVAVSRIYKALAELNRRAGQKDRASILDAQRLKLWQEWNARLPHNFFVGKNLIDVNN